MATEYEIDRMVVRLIGDQENYQKMLKDVEKQTQESASWAERQGAKISSAFSNAFKSAQGMVASVGSTMQRAGAASAALGGVISAPLGKAAVDFADYGKSIREVIRDSEEASKRAATMKKFVLENSEAYKELERSIKLSAEEASIFKLMSERTGLSIETLTKTIKVGSSDFATWRREAERFGLVLGKEGVKAANDLGASWSRVKSAMSGMWTQAGSAVAKGFEELNKVIEGIVVWTTKWIQENKALIGTIAEVAFKAALVGSALLAIGTALVTISPLIGPVVAAVAAGALAWSKYETELRSAYDSVVKYGKQIVDYVSKVMTGVFDALKAGNLELAVEIMWSGAKVAWMNALNEIDRITGERFSAIFKNLSAGNWRNAAEAAVTEVKILWLGLLQTIDPILTEVMNRSRTIWTSIVNSADKAFTELQNILGIVRATFEDVATSVMVKWEFVKTFFSGLGDFIRAIWGLTFGNMFSIVSAFVSNIKPVLSLVKDLLSAAMKGLGGILAASIAVPVQAALKAFEIATGQAIDTAKIASEIAGAGIDVATSSPVIEAGKAMASAMSGAGKETETTSARDVERTRAEGRNARLDQRTAERMAAEEKANADRMYDLTTRQLLAEKEMYELEQRRNELAKAGEEDAAKALETEQKNLKTKIDQAEAERKSLEDKRASSDETYKTAEEIRRNQEEALELERKRATVFDRYDPVKKYMEQMKQLNAMFSEAEKKGDVFKRAIDEVKEDLIQGGLKYNVEFTVSGMDAVRHATREEQQLIENTMEIIARRREEDKAMKEVAAREAEAAKVKEIEGVEAAVEASYSGDTADKTAEESLLCLSRISTATEKLADRPTLQLDPLGLA